jgi:hypothetical protein
MKNKQISLLGIAGVVLFSAFTFFNNQKLYTPRESGKGLSVPKQRTIAEAAKYYFMLRRNQVTNTIPEEAMLQAKMEVEAASRSRAAVLGLNWIEMGPDNVGGRTRAILIDYVHDPSGNTIFAGGVAGGLWKSTTAGAYWTLVSDQWENISVVSIAQSPSGRIYVGTGEYLLAVRGTPGTGNSSCIGGGIWASDDGSSFSQLASTDPTPSNANGNNNNTFNGDWSYVYSLAASPNSNRIYAGTRRGMRISDDNGTTWINPVKNAAGNPSLEACVDIQISAGGKRVIASVGNKCYVSDSKGDDDTFDLKSSTQSGLPISGLSNLKLTISLQDSNYIYAIAARGGTYDLLGVYKSTNGGDTWTTIASGGSLTFQPLANQGDYNCCIAVSPGNKEQVMIGGLDLYKYTNTSGWNQLSAWFYSPFSPLYVHADNHAIVYNKLNPNIVYIANDGGLYKSSDGGSSFTAITRGYNTTQFYSVAFSNTGKVLGGTQDNGTNYINFQGNSPMAADEVLGGDGFDCEISGINEDAFFGSLYFGNLYRSANQGAGGALFFSGAPTAYVDNSSFHTVVRLWESFNNPNSQDSITYTVPAGQTITNGQNLTVNSKTNNTPFVYTNNQGTFQGGDSIKIKDPVQSRIAIGMINGASNPRVFLTNRPLDFSTDPFWFPVFTNEASLSTIGSDPLGGEVNCLAFSGDGNHLYVGTSNGNVYRVSNLNTIRLNSVADTITGWIGRPGCQLTSTRLGAFGNRVVTSISVDPNNADKIIVTLGNYDNTAYVYRITDATTALSSTNTSNFTSIQGNLPKMPVYSSVIDYSNGNRIIIGTEYGIWVNDNGGTTWTKESNGIANTQVFMLRQQTLPYNRCWNSGFIYAATHGRGIFRTETLTGIGKPEQANAANFENKLRISPNPVTDQATVEYFLKNEGQYTAKIYDLSGKLQREINLGAKSSGSHKMNLQKQDLPAGTYLFTISGGGDRVTSKFIVKD